MKFKHLMPLAFTSVLLMASCGNQKKEKTTIVAAEKTAQEEMKSSAPDYDPSKPETVLAAIEYAQGGWNDLYNKKDVSYTYDYRYPDGKADVSTEKYIFSSEASYGKYVQHDINAMPGTEGDLVQFFDGNKTIAMLDGKKVEDEQAMAVSDFLRKANYFWFVMPYKLNDEGTIAKFMGQEEHNGTNYDKIEITYDPAVTGKEQNDTYILYVNPETKLIDRFYFSLPFLGVNDPVIIANYKYEEIEGQQVATKRTYFMPSENGYAEEPNIVQTLTNVKFNNGFTTDTLMEEE